MCKQDIGADDEWYDIRRFNTAKEQIFGQQVCVPCMERADAAAQLTYIRTYTMMDPNVFIPEHSHQMKG